MHNDPKVSGVRSYSLIVESQEGGYLAFFPSLPGCHTWGTSYEEAVKNAEEALTVYLETLASHGDPVPVEADIDKPASLGVIVRTPVDA